MDSPEEVFDWVGAGLFEMRAEGNGSSWLRLNECRIAMKKIKKDSPEPPKPSLNPPG
jgi:hypothetical protein